MLVGIGTEIPSETNALMAALDMAILIIFTIECTLRGVEWSGVELR